MLKIPIKGITPHNVELDVFCDWIEGSVLFVEKVLSTTDIVDALCEDYIYTDQDKGFRVVADAWTELRRRQVWIGSGAPFSITGRRITRRSRSWENTPAHSFCVLLALAKWYSRWAKQFGSDYTEQGELFEELTKESLETQFSGWRIHLTGWSRTRANMLASIVADVETHLGEHKGDVGRWTKPRAKEAGLDLLCYRPFPDGRVGVPVYLMQCASGGDWEGKLHTPNLKIWTKVIEFAATPRKAFATPFAFTDRDFIQNSNLVDGMLLDRYRLLSAAQHRKNWLSSQLRNRIVAWATPRVTELPRRNG